MDKRNVMDQLAQCTLWSSLSTIIVCCTPLKDSEFMIAFDTRMTVDGSSALTYNDFKKKKKVLRI